MHWNSGCVGGDAKKLLCVYIRINPRVSPSVCIINAGNTNKKYLKKSFFFPPLHLDTQWSTRKKHQWQQGSLKLQPSTFAPSHPCISTVIMDFEPSLGSNSSTVPTAGAQRSASYTVSSSANTNVLISADFCRAADNCRLLVPKILWMSEDSSSA